MTLFYIGLSFLSNNQQNKCLSTEARRILSLLEGRPLKEKDIAKEENGRPFFPGRDTDFSISHSGTAVAVSLVRGQNLHAREEGQTPAVKPSPGAPGKKAGTGCDIQLVRPRKNIRKIAEEFFCAAERDYIFPPGKTQYDPAKFFHIWALKECFLKLRGLSIFDMPKVPSFITYNAGDRKCCVLNTNIFPSISFYLYELADTDRRYILAAAIEGAGEIRPEICWFSHPPAELIPSGSFCSKIASTFSIKTPGQAKQDSPALMS